MHIIFTALFILYEFLQKALHDYQTTINYFRIH